MSPLVWERWLTYGSLRVRVGLWLCGLPLLLQVFSLPTLLHRLTRALAGEGPCYRDCGTAVSGAAVSPPALPAAVPTASLSALLRVDPHGLSGRNSFWCVQNGGGAARP
jgi:hypothetical protein